MGPNPSGPYRPAPFPPAYPPAAPPVQPMMGLGAPPPAFNITTATPMGLAPAIAAPAVAAPVAAALAMRPPAGPSMGQGGLAPLETVKPTATFNGPPPVSPPQIIGSS